MMVLDFVKELRLIVNNDNCSVEFHVFDKCPFNEIKKKKYRAFK
jgi:hypothetical protein